MNSLYETYDPFIFNSDEKYQATLSKYILKTELKFSIKDIRKKLLLIQDMLEDPEEKIFEIL